MKLYKVYGRTGYNIREGSITLAERYALLGAGETTTGAPPVSPQADALPSAEQAVPQVVTATPDARDTPSPQPAHSRRAA